MYMRQERKQDKIPIDIHSLHADNTILNQSKYILQNSNIKIFKTSLWWRVC